MTDPEIDRDKIAKMEGGMIIVAAVVFAITAWVMDEPPSSWNLDKNPVQPVEIRYFPIPEPTPIRPSLLMDWPLSERMVDIDNEIVIAKESTASIEEPRATEESVGRVERSGYRRHLWRYRRHWRRR